MGRAPCCEKVGLKRGRWTAEEDETLTKYIQANGEGSWRSLPKNAGLLRCGKSCRLRWINYLRSDLRRGNISSEEEEIIIKLHATMGNRSVCMTTIEEAAKSIHTHGMALTAWSMWWSVIAGQLPGRTDNEIKNYWNSHLSRKILTVRRPSPAPISTPSEKAPTPPIVTPTPSKRRGGRTSRAAMKITKSYKASLAKTAAARKPPPENVICPANNTPPPLMSSSTPVVEKERLILSSAVSWQEEAMAGIMLDTCGMEDNEDGTEMLCINDIMDNGGMEQNDGVLMSLTMGGGESDNSNNEGVILKIQDNNEIATCDQGQSCTSTNSTLDYVKEIGDWDWDFGNDLLWGQNSQYACDDEQEKGLLWPWDIRDDEDHEEGVIGRDIEKVNAMVAWLLS